MQRHKGEKKLVKGHFGAQEAVVHDEDDARNFEGKLVVEAVEGFPQVSRLEGAKVGLRHKIQPHKERHEKKEHVEDIRGEKELACKGVISTKESVHERWVRIGGLYHAVESVQPGDFVEKNLHRCLSLLYSHCSTNAGIVQLARITAFQAVYTGSSPVTRSTPKST